MATSRQKSPLEIALYDLILNLSYSFADIRFVGRSQTIWLEQPDPSGFAAFIESYRAPQYLNHNKTRYTPLSFDSLLIHKLTDRFKYLSLISDALYSYDVQAVCSAIRKNIAHIAHVDKSLEQLELCTLFPHLKCLTLERAFPEGTNILSTDDFPQIKPLIFDRFYLEALEEVVTNHQKKPILQGEINLFGDCLKAMDMAFNVINSLTVQSGGRANKKDSDALEIVSDRFMEFIRIKHYLDCPQSGLYSSYVTIDFDHKESGKAHYLTRAIYETSSASKWFKRKPTVDHPLLEISKIAFQGFITRYCAGKSPDRALAPS